MSVPSRNPSSWTYEQARAILSMAGFRQILQTSIAVNASSENTYTVQDPGTRRVVAVHLSSGNGDIRFNINATATGTTFPVIPTRYFVIDAHGPLYKATPPSQTGSGGGAQITVPADVLHFFNNAAGSVTVFLAEIE